MKVSLLQLDIVWGNPDVNIEKAECLMSHPADMYVLPEMWATGYSKHPEEVAEDEERSKALAWMRATAKERHCAISGSLAIKDKEGHYRNRHYFVTPDHVVFYDKHHLFTYANEHLHYTAGQQHLVVTYGGLRFLLLTCYDLRFPVWSRYGRAGEYDAIIYVANWPHARQYAWDTLLRARAIENMCYVIGVNRVGCEKHITFSGGSVVIDPLGHPLASCDDLEQMCTAVISPDKVLEARMSMPVLADRD